MKLFNQLLTKVIGVKDGYTFEEKIVLSSIFFLCIISFAGIYINIIIGLGYWSIIVALVTFIIYSFAYFLARFYNKLILAKVVFTVFSFFLCNLLWLGNYGSRGPTIYIFLPYISIVIFIWKNKQIKIISFAILANVLLLMIVELFFPEISPGYPTERARVIDSYTGLLMFMGVTVIMVAYAKNNYIYEYQRAKKSDMLKSAFLANMSHEIRTPLNAILGFSKLLVNREMSKEKKELYSNIISDNSDYLLKLVSDILDISMIEAGQMKINLKEVNINNLIIKVLNNQRNYLKESKKQGVKFESNIPDCDLIMYTDELRLEQILTNIVNNAIKFTSQGYIQIGYQVNNGVITFYIEDTGIGIKPEYQTEIFNRFVKFDETVDQNFTRGAGIGLALTKELVQILGGKISFKTEYLKGTTFYFTLPIV